MGCKHPQPDAKGCQGHLLLPDPGPAAPVAAPRSHSRCLGGGFGGLFHAGPGAEKFLWPGFGDNIRVMEWIFNRTDGKAEAASTPIGLVPTPGSLNTEGLGLTDAQLSALLHVDRELWHKEVEHVYHYYDSLMSNDATPVPQVRNRLSTRLCRSPCPLRACLLMLDAPLTPTGCGRPCATSSTPSESACETLEDVFERCRGADIYIDFYPSAPARCQSCAALETPVFGRYVVPVRARLQGRAGEARGVAGPWSECAATLRRPAGALPLPL